jgi:hypothetical protein
MEPAALTLHIRALHTRVMMQVGTVLRKQYEPFVRAPLPAEFIALLQKLNAGEGKPDGPDRVA